MSYYKYLAMGLLPLLSLSPLAHGEPLAEKLEARSNQKNPKITPEIRKAFKEGLDATDQADVVSKAKQVGDLAPNFTLTNAKGEKITLNEELKKGPVILTWYRGGWWPYCNLALAGLQAELPAITKAGATLFALSPELPDKSLSTKEKNALAFEVLTDLNQKVAKDYNLVFKLTPEVEKLYGKFFDLEATNGAGVGTDHLPLAATYIIGQDGKILWAFLHHDYRKRAEPSDLVEFLEKMP